MTALLLPVLLLIARVIGIGRHGMCVCVCIFKCKLYEQSDNLTRDVSITI